MEIINNFNSIYCFITFIFGAVFILIMIYITVIGKTKKPKNNVHFYIARNKNGTLWLFMGKPFRYEDNFIGNSDKLVFILTYRNFNYLGLNENDYANLKWEDEPVEVYLNLEN